jgi:hypothetical protein
LARGWGQGFSEYNNQQWLGKRGKEERETEAIARRMIVVPEMGEVHRIQQG